MIGEWIAGQPVEGCFLLKSAVVKNAASGKPFLSAALSDRSGTIEVKVWNYSGPIGQKDEGKIVKVKGTVSEYRGTLQLVADQFFLAEEDEPVSLEDLVPVAPIDPEESWNVIQAAIDSLQDPDYRRLCRTMMERFGQEFQRIPAAKSVHHAFIRGLLMHTVSMLHLADFLARQYGSLIDRNLLIAGTLLHDLAKIWEFELSPLGLVTRYSLSGQLIGHLVLGAQKVAKTAEELNLPEEKSLLLQHMILSHHGEPEFGAAVPPQCAEAELLSMIDRIDSRMEIYREALEQVEPGEFSSRIFALEKKIYRHS